MGSTIEYIIIGLISGVGIGFVGGIYLSEYYLTKPTTAYTADLNGDDRDDLVINRCGGIRTLMFQQEDGTYSNLD